MDDTGTLIGRKYARTDEIGLNLAYMWLFHLNCSQSCTGIPFGITIDFETAEKSPATVTLREIITMAQVRLPVRIAHLVPHA